MKLAAHPSGDVEHVSVLIVGGGPVGLATALERRWIDWARSRQGSETVGFLGR